MVKVHVVRGDARELIDLPRIPVPGEIFHYYGNQPELDGSARVKAVIYDIDTYHGKTESKITKGLKLEKILVVLEPTSEKERDMLLSSFLSGT